MVAYRFAELFYTQNAAAAATEKLLDDFERELDRILVDTARS